MDPREKISSGPNEAAVNETIAGTGPGIPDEALTPGQDLVTTSQALFKRADEALYNAKAAGRNRVEVAGS